MTAANRVIINTVAQYIRSILSVIITLYTSRVILENLGANDFGIYCLVGGTVSLLSFIQINLSRTTQRFLNYHSGRGDKNMVNAVFNNSLWCQLFAGILLCSILWGCTDAIFENLLNIAPDRMGDAKAVYHIMIIMLFVNLLGTPFYAALIAHENIMYSSIVQIGEAVLKLPVAISLFYISDGKLVAYSTMMCAVSVFGFICYAGYSSVKYSECRQISLKKFNLGLTKEMLAFMLWTVYGTFAITGRSQGIAILLNRAFSTAVNAAYGIGNQIVGHLSFLSVALTTAINPQIIKAEGCGDRARVFRLAEISSKYSFLLISVILVPIFVYIDTILFAWLGNVPAHTATFCRWVIVISLIDWLTQSLNAVSMAVGNVRNFNLIVNSITLCTVPAVYLILKFEVSVQNVMSIYALFTFFAAAARLIFLYRSVNFPIKKYCTTLFACVLPIFGINCVACYFLSDIFTGWWCLATGACSVLITVTGIFTIGLKEDERTIFGRFFGKIGRRVPIFNLPLKK